MVINRRQFAASLIGVAALSACVGIFATHMLENAAGQQIRGFISGETAAEIMFVSGIKPSPTHVNDTIKLFRLTSTDLMLPDDGTTLKNERGMIVWNQL